jgi:hypothetical protein
MRIRKKVWVALLSGLLCFAACVSGQTYQSHIEHPIVQYKMSAQLDPPTKIVKGHYTLTWWNHTEDTIPDLYFHLYLNAFKNMDSTFMREGSTSRRAGLLRFWTTKPESLKWGWVDIDKLQIVGGDDLTKAITLVHPDDDNAMDQTVARVVLPRPIPPHGSLELSVDFTSKLPRGLARTGFLDDYFLVAQWFPKIAVYEGPGDRGRKAGGWNCHQFHANTEFFADYGSWDVDLTVPTNYKVAATGYRRSESQNGDTTTYNYYQQDVHDFAWTASPNFVVLTRTFEWGKEVRGDEVIQWSKTLNLPVEQIALRDVKVILMLQPDHMSVADRYFRAVFNGLKYFGLWYGQYPYDTLTLVDPARGSNTGGMEYPTFIAGGAYFWPGERQWSPEGVTVHEFGHQFWYGLVGNNEFEEAWLDEGFNTYSTGKVIETAYGNGCGYRNIYGMPLMATTWLRVPIPEFPFAGVGDISLGPTFSCVEEPERTSERDFYLDYVKADDLVRFGWQYLDGASYGLNSYTRTALTLRTLESYLGAETMARVMRTYQQRLRYRHPCTQDFIDVVNEVSGRDMNWFFQQFFYSSNLPEFKVSEVSSAPVEGKVGIYDENGKKATYSEKDSQETSAQSKTKLYRTTVVVRRMGEVTVPVDVDVHFDSGETVREHWDGQYRWVKYVYEKPAQVTYAVVDPEQKLAMEADFTDTSRTVKGNDRAAKRWYLRCISWLEYLFFAGGFFS